MIIDRMTRLSGQFEVQGSVQPGDGHHIGEHTLPVSGRSACESYFPQPGAQCELRVQWPPSLTLGAGTALAEVVNLDPVIILFGGVWQPASILHMLVDGNGIAESGLGHLYSSDTLVTQTKCAVAEGNCERVLRVTAKDDLKEVLFEIHVNRDLQRAFSLKLAMRRIDDNAPLAGRERPGGTP